MIKNPPTPARHGARRCAPELGEMRNVDIEQPVAGFRQTLAASAESPAVSQRRHPPGHRALYCFAP
jgi:hypothetical protein